MTGRRCPTCLARIDDPSAREGFVCAACRRRPPPWDRFFAAWFYEPPLREVLIGLKFARLEYLAIALGTEILARFGDQLATCDAVVPVPLHWRRSLTRGYNQAELLARAVARGIGRPMVNCLVRRRWTRAQTGLDRATRRRNLRGAFEWRRGLPPLRATPGRRWLLVDDVYTTGATLGTAARALRRAGAQDLTVLVIAATPDPISDQLRISTRNSLFPR